MKFEVGSMTDFEDGIRAAAELMAISARTAPKAKGEDLIEIRILHGKQVEELGKAMVKYGEDEKDAMWKRDGNCVLKSAAVLLVGVRDPVAEGAPAKRAQAQPPKVTGDLFAEDERVKKCIDLGIALGSAAKTASILNLDNRIMWRPGEMARRKGMLDALIVIAIPVSVSGKSIFFDRPA
jgi:uncharacterized ferredoxin-like protein